MKLFFLLLSFLSQYDGLLEEVQVQLNALQGVVVAGDGVGDDVRVAVGVHDTNRGDADLGCIHNDLREKF